MTEPLFLSRFTPSVTSPGVLESIFVQRAPLAEHLVELIRESVLSPAKHHALMIGPRGVGKTHLLSVVHHRIVSQEDLHPRMRVAWLWEEEWGVASYLDLLYRILRSLAKTYRDEHLGERTEQLFAHSPGVAQRRAGELLRSYLDGRTLVLIAENLDDLFAGLGTKGQQHLRAFLQEEGSCAIVASAQGLFKGISLHQSPFYGFFDIHHLQELSVDDAVRLVGKIASLVSDDQLAQYVQTPGGKDRIRAVHHLAGGNHRVYVILSEFLTRESLDQLVDPFLRTIDDLTPYYQSRMAQLSPQQRKIVDFLCDTRGAAPVKQIAARCFITQQTASSQLKDLRDRGFVRVTPIGRDAYYEVAEPLMRITLEVKKQRGGPVRLFLEFLRHWYGTSELEARLLDSRADDVVEREYVRQVLEEARSSVVDLGTTSLLRKLTAMWEKADHHGAMLAAQQLVRERGSADDWVCLATCHMDLEHSDEAIGACDKALRLDPGCTSASKLRASILLNLGRLKESLSAADQAVAADDDDGLGHGLRGAILLTLGRSDEALKELDRSLSIDPELLWARRGRVGALLNLQRAADALGESDQVFARGSEIPSDWTTRGTVLASLGKLDEALECYTRAVHLDPDQGGAWLNLGSVSLVLGNLENAYNGFRTALLFDDGSPMARQGLWFCLHLVRDYRRALDVLRGPGAAFPADFLTMPILIELLCRLGRYDEAVALLEEVGDASGNSAPGQDDLLQGRVLLGLGRVDEAEERLCAWADRARPDDNWWSPARPLAELLRDLFWNTDDEDERASRARSLLRCFTRGNGEVLVAALGLACDVLVEKKATLDRVMSWEALWTRLLGELHGEFYSLTWIRALTRFRDSGDARALLSVPAEERLVLERMIADEKEHRRLRKLWRETLQSSRAASTA